ncbi:DUF2610 domain-containing protein [Sphingomonas sp. AOB5]|uniref:DUF2610 domain-containing protein n=1 Tax=Sphingomonas sp. AOB5 TaxID=3034017 RepID=UPI0023F79279|nr:DUF2610 domain-containing protein [Sphingomonas sp. AOB5]MDF7775797.1 DUF2610 domain-containing protein [Sphingomonas sp. AOB5]
MNQLAVLFIATLLGLTSHYGSAFVSNGNGAPQPRATPTPTQASSGTGLSIDKPRTESPQASPPPDSKPDSGDISGGLNSRETTRMLLIFADTAERSGDSAGSTKTRRQLFDDRLAQLKATPKDTPEYITLLRDVSEAGYFLIWGLYDDYKFDDARGIITEINNLLAPYRKQKPPPALVLPLTRMLWVEYSILIENDPAADKRVLSEILALTVDPDAYPDDYLFVANRRYGALWSMPGETRAKSRQSACALAAEMDRVISDEDSILRLMKCDVEAATTAQNAKTFPAAFAALERARQKGRQFLKEEPDSTVIQMMMVSIELTAYDIESGRKRKAEAANYQLTAANLFIAAIDGRAYPQTYRTEISDTYDRFNDLEFADLPQYTTAEARTEASLKLFQRIGTAIERSRQVFPLSPSYALVAADAWVRVAKIQRERKDLPAADKSSELAVTAIAGGRLVSAHRNYSELPTTECEAYAVRIRVLIELDRTDAAITTNNELQKWCGPWIQRYPWDFYMRQHWVSSANRLGIHLHRKRRYAEAIPLLELASNWGTEESSFYLADIYRNGRGVPADGERASYYTTLGSRQGMKRFTVPTDFAGTKFPFHVYVLHYPGPLCPVQKEPLPPELKCAGFTGIDDQVEWVKQARGGHVPDDVTTSFQKLEKIARDNNVSFPELAVYALGLAQNEDAENAKKKAISGKNTTKPAPPRQIAAKPKAAAPPPPPRARVAPVSLNSRFFYHVRGAPRARWIEATVVPYRPGEMCFSWVISVAPQKGDFEFFEEFRLPSPPKDLPEPSERISVLEGRQMVRTRLSDHIRDGEISSGWCIGEGDPMGTHTIQVWYGKESLAKFEFDLVE